MRRALEAEFEFGSDTAEIVTGNRVDVVAELVVDGQSVVEGFRAIVEVELDVLDDHDPAFEPNVGRLVTSQCRARDRGRRSGRQ